MIVEGPFGEQQERRPLEEGARPVPTLLIIAIILFLLFGGLGFVVHLLWWGLIIALVVLIVSFVANRA